MRRDRSLKNLKRGGQPGRTKGVPNKATVEVKEAARQLVEQADYRAALARRLRSGRLAPAMETTLWHYAYGKPTVVPAGAGGTLDGRPCGQKSQPHGVATSAFDVLAKHRVRLQSVPSANRVDRRDVAIQSLAG
jgi:hypothetical protein